MYWWNYLFKAALLDFYKHGFEVYELAGALKVWKGMSLFLEDVEEFYCLIPFPSEEGIFFEMIFISLILITI